MMDFDMRLTRRRVLASILVIGLAAAAAGVGTFALFSDDATAENSINAGTLELGTANGSFTVDGLYPTQSTGEQTITTTYDGGVTSDLTVDVTVDETQSGFADQLTVETAELTVDGSSVGSVNGNTLADLEDEYPDVAALSDGDTVALAANLTLAESTGNEFQGEGVDITVSFNATQQT